MDRYAIPVLRTDVFVENMPHNLSFHVANYKLSLVNLNLQLRGLFKR